MADSKTEEKKDTSTQAKEVAQTPPAPAKKVAATDKPQDPVVSVHRINGSIEPGTIFRPVTAQDAADLAALGAVRELTEAEAALFEKQEAAANPLG